MYFKALLWLVRAYGFEIWAEYLENCESDPTLQGVQASFMLVLFLGEKRLFWWKIEAIEAEQFVFRMMMMALDVRNFLCVKEEKLLSYSPRRSCTKIELDE